MNTDILGLTHPVDTGGIILTHRRFSNMQWREHTEVGNPVTTPVEIMSQEKLQSSQTTER